ncbi:hypothetical protein DID88_005208 [Monilinia fructigena]|uniref:Uncharacterized protein n=1 Tax=Monilinia fructigena TaxID=38457 RepID=A0A395IDQ9_9HELO|nr:hypothetical protein DID88_005208 [Monilinia fructigena]
MPSLSSFLRHRSESQNENRMSLSLSVTPEKVQRKSKRTFLRNLLKISSFPSREKSGKDQTVTVPTPTSPNIPASPMSNHNKPLPPHHPPPVTLRP